MEVRLLEELLEVEELLLRDDMFEERAWATRAAVGPAASSRTLLYISGIAFALRTWSRALHLRVDDGFLRQVLDAAKLRDVDIHRLGVARRSSTPAGSTRLRRS